MTPRPEILHLARTFAVAAAIEDAQAAGIAIDNKTMGELRALPRKLGQKPPLKGHRAEQLQLLRDAGAISKESAVAVSFDRAYRPGTLSRLFEERLVGHAQLPFKGDSRRRVSHYWITAAGLEAIA